MTDLPIELGRDQARRLAQRELADPIYEAEPPIQQVIWEWLVERLGPVIDGASGALGGMGGLIVLGLIAAIVAVIVIRYSPLAKRAAVRAGSVFEGAKRTAAAHRSSAEEAARRGDWAAAVVERYRAVVAELEERAVLDPRPGRTADEAAREAGRAVPDLAEDLRSGAVAFDDVHYGGHDATQADAGALRALDDAVRTARAQHGEAEPEPILAVPR